MLVFGGVVFQPSFFGELLIFEEVFDKHLYCPKYPDPSKVPILRTYTPLLYRFVHPSIGGSNRGSLGWDKRLNSTERFTTAWPDFSLELPFPSFQSHEIDTMTSRKLT